jgi:hypothetical protein
MGGNNDGKVEFRRIWSNDRTNADGDENSTNSLEIFALT